MTAQTMKIPRMPGFLFFLPLLVFLLTGCGINVEKPDLHICGPVGLGQVHDPPIREPFRRLKDPVRLTDQDSVRH